MANPHGAVGHVRIEGDEEEAFLPQQPAPSPLPVAVHTELPPPRKAALQRAATALQGQKIGDARIEGESDEESEPLASNSGTTPARSSRQEPAASNTPSASEMIVRLPCGTCQAILPSFLLEWDGAAPFIEKTVRCDQCGTRQHIKIEPKMNAAPSDSAVTKTESGYHT
jgi:hypothetical protein